MHTTGSKHSTQPLSIVIVFFAVVLVSGCIQAPTYESRTTTIDRLISSQQWKKQTLITPTFTLASYVPNKVVGSDNSLTVYIEGDGLAWVTKSLISQNPTPTDPVALKMAMKHPPDRNAAYLARPCQYVKGPDFRLCRNKYWTNARFAEKVITASNSAIDQLKKQFAAKRIILVGYSGGGAVAALVAARRNDIAEIITVAGNLDHVTWTRHHKISPLKYSLNPPTEWRALSKIPQVHWVGGQDRIIPYKIASAYQSRFINGPKPIIKTKHDYDHHCCWAEQWPQIIEASLVP